MNSWRIIIQRARASRLSRLDGHMEGVLQSVSLLGRGYVLTLGLGCGIAIGLLLSLRKNNVSSTARLTGVQNSELFNFDHVNGEHKMVLVVRNDLKMGKGKVAAQCAHAAIGAYKRIEQTDIHLLKQWDDLGAMKVVVKAPDEQSLLKAASEASQQGLNTYIVRDAGRTQIAPGSKTVLCVGPGPTKQVDAVTGEFKLL